MKAMASEINMLGYQLKEEKYKHTRLTQEYIALKKDLYQHKKMIQMLKPKVKSKEEFPLQHPPNQPQVAGGGFSISNV